MRQLVKFAQSAIGGIWHKARAKAGSSRRAEGGGEETQGEEASTYEEQVGEDGPVLQDGSGGRARGRRGGEEAGPLLPRVQEAVQVDARRENHERSKQHVAQVARLKEEMMADEGSSGGARGGRGGGRDRLGGFGDSRFEEEGRRRRETPATKTKTRRTRSLASASPTTTTRAPKKPTRRLRKTTPPVTPTTPPTPPTVRTRTPPSRA